MSSAVLNFTYLVSSVLFIVGLKFLGSPRTARMGNLCGAFGMLVAIIATLVSKSVISFSLIFIGLAAGSIIGVLMASFVQMTAMPQMVAILNGFGGAASTFVAGGEYYKYLLGNGDGPTTLILISIALSALIGSVAFTGSLVAFGKLQGIVSGRPVKFPLQNVITVLLALGILAVSVSLITREPDQTHFIILSSLAGILGFLLVMPIGGGDMPVIIALLNSYSGLAAAATGFVFSPPNNMLIISGSLVGASGLILTAIMCKAMNRSLMNVCFGGFGQIDESSATASKVADRPVRSGTAEDAAILFDGARNVIIVPGYGMAVAQAQHVVKELEDVLEKKGISVKYAIHPVAGRMPGHMNVLLAEANVAYDKLCELETINPQFPEADVALVVGANDITNPAARTDKSSPLYGMPILEVDRSRSIIVLKRSLNPGFAGVDNDLYYNEKTMMVFGDAKKSLTELATVLNS